jgi:hypothetical protein
MITTDGSPLTTALCLLSSRSSLRCFRRQDRTVLSCLDEHRFWYIVFVSVLTRFVQEDAKWCCVKICSRPQARAENLSKWALWTIDTPPACRYLHNNTTIKINGLGFLLYGECNLKWYISSCRTYIWYEFLWRLVPIPAQKNTFWSTLLFSITLQCKFWENASNCDARKRFSASETLGL